MTHPVLLFYLFLLLRAGAGAAAKLTANAEQRFAMEPQDQTAIVGSRVTLPCRVVNKSGQLQWTKDDFGLGTQRNLSGFERYTMVGSDEEGDFSLEISPVMLDDDAKYQCQVGPGKGGTPGIRSRFAKLSVLVPPEAPKIVQGGFLMTTEGREIELECVSAGGKPAAEITWIDGHGNVLVGGIEYVREPLRDARRFTAKSILKLTPKKEHHNTTFTCQAQNTADRTYRSVRLQLEVKYAPKVRIAVIGGALNGGRLTEGTEVRLSCQADANPPDLSFRWFVDDELAESGNASDLIIANVSRRYHGTVVRCEVRNAVGKSEESSTLDISYGPRFRELPRSVEADLDTPVTLQCDVDGNPAPDVVWVHEPTEQIVASWPNVTLAVTSATSGRYLCKASVPGFAVVEAEATVFLRGPPLISSPRQQHCTVGERAQLVCTAFAIPPPRHVLWSFNGHEISGGITGTDEPPEDYAVVEHPLADGVRSVLSIGRCRREHFGTYNCTIVNDYGIDIAEIDFLSKDKNLLPVIALVLLGVITFLILVIAIGICLCSRRIKKKHLPPADVIPKHDVQGKDGSEHCSVTDTTIRGELPEVQREVPIIGTSLTLNIRSPDTGSATAALSSSLTTLKAHCGDSTSAAAAAEYSCSRYSGDYSDSLSILQCKKGGQQDNNSNGYVPYVNYSHDYSPPASHLLQHLKAAGSGPAASGKANGQLGPANMMATLQRKRITNTDARLDVATLPNIQSSMASLPNALMNNPIAGCHIGLDTRFLSDFSPHERGGTSGIILPPPATANPAATPAPPPYSAIRQQSCLLGLQGLPVGCAGREPGIRGPGSNTGTTTTTNSQAVLLTNTTTAAANTTTTSSSSPGSTQSGSVSLASSQASQPAPAAVSGSGQFILPSSGSAVKHGVLATHV
ncbi:irregular chiasm C-roughest protein-like [Anopheles cruzii]|uniref:irregular chiasm C-roughest protein-like n=1 Tax=Anopheles cruzii TaxID=68878 RepID=UPI0022EC4144|nr:irregular chiasm C-roughest protein-like [Anopheles cruzii]